MKKLVIAAAIAVMSSSVLANATVYGVLDASVHNISKASATGDSTALVDSAVVSSLIGFRGSEDLGGGLRAVFQIEGDVQTNNGGTHQSGVFRRGAYTGIAGGFGEVTLGLRLNPVIAGHSALMPLSGNSFTSTLASAFGYADFYTKNAITYTTPTTKGFRAQIQHGLTNTAGLKDSGTVTAGHVSWAIGDLTLQAAGQDRKGTATTSSANSSATAAQGDVTTVMYGLQYKITKDFTAAVAQVKNDVAGDERKMMQYGVRYNVSPKTSLGANYMTSDTADNTLTNVQARYAMSKRTTLYAQYSAVDNKTLNSIRPVNTTTGTSPAVNISGFAAVNNASPTAVGVGIIHTF